MHMAQQDGTILNAHTPQTNSEQCEGTSHENVGFRDKKGQRVHPNFATVIAMDFHHHTLCAPEIGGQHGISLSLSAWLSNCSHNLGPWRRSTETGKVDFLKMARLQS